MTDTLSPLESALASIDTAKLYDQLVNADVANFIEINDLWKPTKKGEQLLGYLVAREKSNFVSDTGLQAHWYGFAALNPRAGKVEPKRVLGTAVIERALANVEIGTIVELTFEGEEKSPKGAVRLFRVRVQP